jgi:hypothetical protein
MLLLLLTLGLCAQRGFWEALKHRVAPQHWKSAWGRLAFLLLLTSTSLAQAFPPRPPRSTGQKTYELSFSTRSDLSNGEVLQGATLSGIRFIFTSPTGSASTSDIAGVAQVCFWRDEIFVTCGHNSQPMTAGAFYFRLAKGAGEKIAILAGTPTRSAALGTHSITQEVMTPDGAFETDTATFTVRDTGKHDLDNLERPGPPQIMGLERPGAKLVDVAFSPSDGKTTEDFLRDLDSNDPHFMAIITDQMTYSVYRMNGACGSATWSPTRIASGIAAMSYNDDSIVGGKTYCYAVTAMDSITALESDYSNKVTAVIPSP